MFIAMAHMNYIHAVLLPYIAIKKKSATGKVEKNHCLVKPSNMTASNNEICIKITHSEQLYNIKLLLLML